MTASVAPRASMAADVGHQVSEDRPQDRRGKRGSRLEEIDAKTREKIGKARALVRVRLWTLLEARDAGFPWISIPGKQLQPFRRLPARRSWSGTGAVGG